MHVDEIIERLKACPEIKTKKAIGEICGGITIQSVRGWKRVPSEHCRLLEIKSGGRVTRYEMRPDVFGPGPNDDSDLLSA